MRGDWRWVRFDLRFCEYEYLGREAYVCEVVVICHRTIEEREVGMIDNDENIRIACRCRRPGRE